MHLEVTSMQPGQKCPQCGMGLVPNNQGSNDKSNRMKLELKSLQMVTG